MATLTTGGPFQIWKAISFSPRPNRKITQAHLGSAMVLNGNEPANRKLLPAVVNGFRDLNLGRLDRILAQFAGAVPLLRPGPPAEVFLVRQPHDRRDLADRDEAGRIGEHGIGQFRAVQIFPVGGTRASSAGTSLQYQSGSTGAGERVGPRRPSTCAERYIIGLALELPARYK